MSSFQNKPHTATLYVVATPIGNLGDITTRAIEVLSTVDIIYCEDTRVTAKLISALVSQGHTSLAQSHSKLRRMDENEIARGGAMQVVGDLARGCSVAYCTDAGMPGVSDPGIKLVDAVLESNSDIKVEVIPGASAVTTALVASGIESTAFYFGGFLPRKDGEIRTALEQMFACKAALIYYESPKRVVSTLNIIADVFSTRQVAVCRELTKMHQEVVRGFSGDVAADFLARESIKGEIVIVIGPPTKEECALRKEQQLESARFLAELLSKSEGYTNRDVAKLLQGTCGISRNDAYDLVTMCVAEA